jgi:hypothetical protein
MAMGMRNQSPPPDGLPAVLAKIARRLAAAKNENAPPITPDLGGTNVIGGVDDRNQQGITVNGILRKQPYQKRLFDATKSGARADGIRRGAE